MRDFIRRFLYTFLLIAVTLPLATYAQRPILAGRRTKSFTDKVEGGSLVITNTLDHIAYELKHIMFTLPVSMTNSLTVAHERIIKLPSVNTEVVYTNEVDSSDVTTNYVPVSGGIATFTNSVTVSTTTNDTTAQVYDGSDFGYGWTFEPNDKVTFTFDCTNALYLIRVYDEYVRP